MPAPACLGSLADGRQVDTGIQRAAKVLQKAQRPSRPACAAALGPTTPSGPLAAAERPWSNRCDAVSVMRRAFQDGHTPRPLQENAIRTPCPHCPQRMRARRSGGECPKARWSIRGLASRPGSTGRPRPFSALVSLFVVPLGASGCRWFSTADVVGERGPEPAGERLDQHEVLELVSVAITVCVSRPKSTVRRQRAGRVGWL